MPYEIIIKETATKENLAFILRNIADFLDSGYSSGYYPTWEIKKIE